MIYINDTLGAYGGGQTLIFRMCKWLKDNNHDVSIICDSDTNDEIRNKIISLNVPIHVVKVWDTKSLNKVFTGEDNNIIVINFAWNQFLNIECYKKKFKKEFKNLIYCIHPETFKKGQNVKNKLLKRYTISHYSEIYRKMNENKSLIMMDEINLDRTNEYLGCSIKLKNPILRIPVFMDETKDAEIPINEGYKSNVIFSSCRAEIPFKGYLIGLIKDFASIHEDYPDSRLEIVSAGDDINVIKEAIASQSENIQKSITLHSWMPFDKLNGLMTKSKVVIGMGTTILDGAKNYKISIPVAMYTLENKADCYFGDHPEFLVRTDDCKSSAKDYLIKVFQMDYETFRSNSLKSFSAVKDNYDINVIMKKMLGIVPNNNCCILNWKERNIHLFGNFVRSIKYRNKKDFDYQKIDKEKGDGN